MPPKLCRCDTRCSADKSVVVERAEGTYSFSSFKISLHSHLPWDASPGNARWLPDFVLSSVTFQNPIHCIESVVGSQFSVLIDSVLGRQDWFIFTLSPFFLPVSLFQGWTQIPLPSLNFLTPLCRVSSNSSEWLLPCLYILLCATLSGAALRARYHLLESTVPLHLLFSLQHHSCFLKSRRGSNHGADWTEHHFS